ncbi:hypothetical protein DNTS_024790, partial [Danionella cerebrum]
MSALEQRDRVCELGVCLEEAFIRRDWLQLCLLPGALHCYRNCCPVVLRRCPESFVKLEEAVSTGGIEQSWSAVIFLSELQSNHQEEKESITALINRVGQEERRLVYLSLCVAVWRAERETQSHTALLVARQHWERWPQMRASIHPDLTRTWLQESLDPPAKQLQGWKPGTCAEL